MKAASGNGGGERGNHAVFVTAVFRDETEASITNNLKRGTFSAIFLLATLAALEAQGIRLDDI